LYRLNYPVATILHKRDLSRILLQQGLAGQPGPVLAVDIFFKNRLTNEEVFVESLLNQDNPEN